MNTFLLHCYFKWNVHFTYANNLGVLQPRSQRDPGNEAGSSALRLIDNHRILLSTRRTPSVVLESNLNCLIHFSHIVINARSIPCMKLIYIPFLKDEAQRTKLFGIRYGYWDTRSDYGFRCACVFIKIHKYVASSRHQLIRRPTILITSLQDADFVYYSFKNVSISSKKTDVFSLWCNFLLWTRRIDRLHLE